MNVAREVIEIDVVAERHAPQVEGARVHGEPVGVDIP
jgi:hypothetical protein